VIRPPEKKAPATGAGAWCGAWCIDTLYANICANIAGASGPDLIWTNSRLSRRKDIASATGTFTTTTCSMTGEGFPSFEALQTLRANRPAGACRSRTWFCAATQTKEHCNIRSCIGRSSVGSCRQSVSPLYSIGAHADRVMTAPKSERMERKWR
jgi:hypothetical protein